MRIAQLTMTAAAAALVTFIAGSSAITAQPRRAAPVAAPALSPLSDRDMSAARGSGCQLSFNTRRGTLVYVIGNEFIIRTPAGRTVCRISDARFAALSSGGSQSCGGYRLTVRQTGRAQGHPESDAASFPATLTVTGRGRPWTARGHWGTAC